MKLKELQIVRVHVREHGDPVGKFLPAEEWEAAGVLECRGEMISPNQWASLYGEHKQYFNIVATVEEEIAEPAFNPNQCPSDSEGEPIREGTYEVRRGGLVRTATVFEADGDWFAQFPDSERPQRVDEMTRACSWIRVEAEQAARAVARER